MSLAPPDQDIVLIGVSGDLARRKLLPAIYDLCANDMLPRLGKIIGMARTHLGEDGFLTLAKEAIEQYSRTGFRSDTWTKLKSRLMFVGLHRDGYKYIRECCNENERLIYLSVPPWAVPEIVADLKEADLATGTRLVLEKPFGLDLTSAIELERLVHEAFSESQIYRIDHYLGKETVQNILVFRFANSMFERIWNRDCIQGIQITMAESIGIEDRPNFYDGVGALRDVIQNHILQVLSLLTMEAPISMSGEAIRDEKQKLLRAMQLFDPDKTVRGQYSAGQIDGKPVPGYREEEGIPPDSNTETFVASEARIDNWRWAGVPFYLRAGKRLPLRTTEVAITFRDVPLYLFENNCADEIEPNRLIIRIQPEEGIALDFQAKCPGPEMHIDQVTMDFSYRDSFMTEPAEAYERLLQDAMDGDQTLFLRADSVKRSWEIVQPVLDNPGPIYQYEAGTWGPPEAAYMIAPTLWRLR